MKASAFSAVAIRFKNQHGLYGTRQEGDQIHSANRGWGKTYDLKIHMAIVLANVIFLWGQGLFHRMNPTDIMQLQVPVWVA